MAEIDQFQKLVENVLMTRQQLINKLTDPRRDVNHECGYPETENLTVQHYRNFYDREPVATRVVEVFPEESWQVQPEVFETEEADVETPFEAAWNLLGDSLRGESWYQDEEGSPVWDHLKRLDVLSGIGSYGLMLLGLDDGQDLSEPAKPREGQRLLFLREFDESLAEVVRYESDPKNPRYNQPDAYLLTFYDPKDSSISSIGLPLGSYEVHHSRVLHVADNLGSSELFGVPRQRPVYNRLHDLQKLYGGSAEMYWRGAFPGLSIETHPQLGGDVPLSDTDLAAMRSQMENYMNGLQRYLSFMGMTAKSLAPQVVDPTPQINVQIDAICVRLAVPKRIFLGSERGELASSQDSKTWNKRVMARQRNYLTPRLIVPFVNRLIQLGVLPQPTGYSVSWPDLNTMTELEKADVALKRTQALMQYVSGGVESVITPLDYLTRIHGMTDAEAASIVQTATDALGEEAFDVIE